MKKFYPVIHCYDLKSTCQNAKIAIESVSDGIFLINHGKMSNEEFYELIEEIQNFCMRAEYSFKIGANFLNLSNIEALEKAVDFGLDMLWVDNAGCDDCDNVQSTEDFFKRSYELDDEMNVEIFGGVHFKYQPKPKSSIYESICYSLMYIDVPTLSGSATGNPADIEIIKEACYALDSYNKGYWPDEGARSLAIASGISVENADSYLPYIDHFLVASSILDEKDERLFDEQKLKTLCDKIHLFGEKP